DDGSRLRIDGADVIVDDGIHAPHDSVYATRTLTAGLHAIEWVWFDAPEALTLALNGNTGAFSGSFKAPGITATTSFSGVLFQKRNLGGGVFLGTSRSGAISLGAL